MEGFNQCIIGLGSNRDREVNIQKSSALLAAWFNDISFSDPILSTPMPAGKPVSDYLNRTAIAHTTKSQEETLHFLKEVEKLLGRTDADKITGSIPIDLDLVKWNDTLLKEKEWKRSYFQQGLQSLKIDLTNR